jgi:secreted trypsin-like serine protease
VCKIGESFALLGVTSWGIRSCLEVGYPDVYTRMTSYLQWINETMETHDVESISDVLPYSRLATSPFLITYPLKIASMKV